MPRSTVLFEGALCSAGWFVEGVGGGVRGLVCALWSATSTRADPTAWSATVGFGGTIGGAVATGGMSAAAGSSTGLVTAGGRGGVDFGVGARAAGVGVAGVAARGGVREASRGGLAADFFCFGAAAAGLAFVFGGGGSEAAAATDGAGCRSASVGASCRVEAAMRIDAMRSCCWICEIMLSTKAVTSPAGAPFPDVPDAARSSRCRLSDSALADTDLAGAKVSGSDTCTVRWRSARGWRCDGNE